MVLVHARKVEPFVLVHVGLKEFHVSIAECAEEALISDVAHAVECEFCGTFLEQNGLDLDVVGLWGSAVVVEETRHL